MTPPPATTPPPAAPAWPPTPPAAPGPLRLRPLPREATASYTLRLAAAYQLTLPQLLDGIGITLHCAGTPPAAELRLTPTARRRLATFARVPLPHLARALPDLARHDNATAGPAAAHWTPLDTRHQPVHACTTCARHRSHGTTSTAWVHPLPHHLLCPRHQQAAPDPRLRSPLDTRAAPELTAAHHAHQRLLRHPRALAAHTAARATTTRWYDHQQHLTHRWHTRLNRLYAANPHLTRAGIASPALLARDLITYPETITLARALLTPPPWPHRDTRNPLPFIARQLGLAHLTPATNDPLHAFLATTPH